MTDAHVSAADFDFVADLVRRRCGLVLEPGKEYLVRARLLPIAQRLGLKGIKPLVDRLRDQDSALATAVVEALVTTETSFFRDVHPFETLTTSVLPALIQARRDQRQLNIWFAASSSGQEPYTVAIILKELFPELSSWRLNLTATDLSLEMLNRSRAGRYSQLEVSRGLSPERLQRWFHREGEFWQIDESLRRMITFQPLNLAEPWPAMPQWDLVLLRNVMIYFDTDTKRLILNRVSQRLARDGYLVLGGAETTLNLDDSFCRVETLKSGFYQLKS